MHIKDPEQHAKDMNWNYNPADHAATRAAYNRKRRALMFGNGPVENIGIEKLFDRDDGLCGICNIHLEDNEKGSIDHVIPLSLGGTHTWDNVQLAHLSCNIAKGNKLDYKIKCDVPP